jgi:hypothetical protein
MPYDNLSSVSQNVLKFYQQLTGEERRGRGVYCFTSPSVRPRYFSSLFSQ